MKKKPKKKRNILPLKGKKPRAKGTIILTVSGTRDQEGELVALRELLRIAARLKQEPTTEKG